MASTRGRMCTTGRPIYGLALEALVSVHSHTTAPVLLIGLQCIPMQLLVLTIYIIICGSRDRGLNNADYSGLAYYCFFVIVKNVSFI